MPSVGRPGAKKKLASGLGLGLTLLCFDARAEPAFAPTASVGVFFEFGDQAGVSGGFCLWAGASLYPDVRPSEAQTTGFVAAGLEIRTGLIPLLAGPNELSPQLRGGLVRLGGFEFVDNDSKFESLAFPEYKVYGIAGYRWASSFGWDNLKGARKDESAFRLGVGAQSLRYLKAIDPVPSPNGLGLMLDVNPNGSIDRYGFDVNVGF